jgi:predicted acetyltransferase
VTPSEAWQRAFQEMANEYQAARDPRYKLALADFPTYLARIAEGRKEEQPLGRVPGAEYWLEASGRILGCARLRFRLTPALEHEGGHVGYDVRPSARRQGYGTRLLALALVELAERGIRHVRVTCDDDNVGSLKIIERNGGALSGRAISASSGKWIRQYWIDRDG